MIQYLKIKVEAQINRLESWIKKTQEMFTKGLEALSNYQLIMNNKIIEIKNKSEENNCRITEAKEWISVSEYKMM